MPKSIILGISAFYHDSAAALLIDGEIVAAAQEERFTRIKHDPGFPRQSIQYVLDEAGIQLLDVDSIAFYEKPWIKFERLLETYYKTAPRGLAHFIAVVPTWIKEKLFLKSILRRHLKPIGSFSGHFYFPEHHLSHSASAFFPSPFESAAILTLDGVGEWATMTMGYGNGSAITFLKELSFPHSLGLLYSAFTAYCGFKVNDGEYKLMGLAPYGDRLSSETQTFITLITTHLIHCRPDGSFNLNMEFFNFETGFTMVKEDRWEALFGFPKRNPDEPILGAHMNLALAIQTVLEDIILKLAETIKTITGSENLVLAGGVALNAVANGKLMRSGLFNHIWVQPAAGDAGGSLGAALAVWHISKSQPRQVPQKDKMKGCLLGPSFSDSDIDDIGEMAGAIRYSNYQSLYDQVVAYLAKGFVVGWFQGRMEFGPRALGARSILADPRQPTMQKTLNLKIKGRESFRPFAPVVLKEQSSFYFEMSQDWDYMTAVVPVKSEYRDMLPAVTHVDGSARVQTLERESNPLFYDLLQAFYKKTGCPILVNTSFNQSESPIVCRPEEAYQCFIETEMDVLVMGSFCFLKNKDKTVNLK